MRVLMVTPALPSAGDPNPMASVVHQIRSLRTLGLDVEVLEVRGRARVKYLHCLPRVRALAEHVDLIHGHFGFCGWLARSQFRRPVVISFMGDDVLGTPNDRGRCTRVSRLVVQINRLTASTVDAVIVKSAEMARVVEPVRAHVLPNGVDLDLFRPMEPGEARRLLRWPEGQYILFPGDPDNPRKGFPLAQRSVSLASQQMGARLELVALKHVVLEQVPLYMNACEAMLMTSFIEGSPNAVKEALACNLPVISVAVGDVREQLAGVTRCAIVPRDAAGIAEALVRSLTSDQRDRGSAPDPGSHHPTAHSPRRGDPGVARGDPSTPLRSLAGALCAPTAIRRSQQEQNSRYAPYSGPIDGRSALIGRGLDSMTVARRLMTIYTNVLARQNRLAARSRLLREELH
jgi:glycosyltransferase involved in cell wall biosynthesis